MEFGILGPLQVTEGGRVVALGAAKQKALLAALLLHANEPVSSDRLIDELWGEQAPGKAAKSVQVYVSQLRKVLGDGRLETRARGYALQIDPGALDAERFQRLLEEGREALGAGEPERAAGARQQAWNRAWPAASGVAAGDPRAGCGPRGCFPGPGLPCSGKAQDPLAGHGRGGGAACRCACRRCSRADARRAGRGAGLR